MGRLEWKPKLKWPTYLVKFVLLPSRGLISNCFCSLISLLFKAGRTFCNSVMIIRICAKGLQWIYLFF